MLTLHHEARFGLARACITRDGLPHLYTEGYEHDSSLGVLGTRSVARLKGRAGTIAFLGLADGSEAMLDIVPPRLSDGAAVEIEIIAEARADKLARARFIGPSEGEPRRLSPVLSLKDRLLARARTFIVDAPIYEAADPDALDTAHDAALDPSGPLSGGGYLHIEPTRALIACDIDGGEGTPREVNARAIADLPRRLRLANLGGLVVVDLIGRKHDAARLHGLLKAGFAAEAPAIIPAPLGRFGTLEFVRPWGAAPLRDTDAALRQARDLLWQSAARALSEPGRIVTVSAPQPVLDRIQPLLSGSLDPVAAIMRLSLAPNCEITT